MILVRSCWKNGGYSDIVTTPSWFNAWRLPACKVNWWCTIINIPTKINKNPIFIKTYFSLISKIFVNFLKSLICCRMLLQYDMKIRVPMISFAWKKGDILMLISILIPLYLNILLRSSHLHDGLSYVIGMVIAECKYSIELYHNARVITIQIMLT